ncbi:hypothetical protein [Massilia sp. Root335]|uniref:hypothetical protein n=1 Tax=Massilia sp. Root335 TaxID=1736517 RepID=UPI0006F894FB|nr:hypothetical protein [Massilia sp. Root335]KQV51950.1 hypothetical protein ASC93_04670 [Massilia sp. Root335]
MKRLALLSIMATAMWAGACQAAEPSLCKSLCDADKSECRANAHELAADDGSPPLEMPEKNPLARAAQLQVPTESSRAIDNAGTQARRIGHAGACDETYLRCTRACAAPAASSVVKPASGRRDGI